METNLGSSYVIDQAVHWIINKSNGMGNNKPAFIFGIILKVWSVTQDLWKNHCFQSFFFLWILSLKFTKCSNKYNKKMFHDIYQYWNHMVPKCGFMHPITKIFSITPHITQTDTQTDRVIFGNLKVPHWKGWFLPSKTASTWEKGQGVTFGGDLLYYTDRQTGRQTDEQTDTQGHS